MAVIYICRCGGGWARGEEKTLKEVGEKNGILIVWTEGGTLGKMKETGRRRM